MIKTTQQMIQTAQRHLPMAGGMALRLGLVGGNFAVLLGLAAALGLDDFGRLIVLWGVALVVSGVIGWGAPLVLLARLGAGAGLQLRAVLLLALGLPAATSAAIWVLGGLVVPAGWPLGAVLAAALGVHLLACLASILRVFGVVFWSMALRDAVPVLALGMAALGGAQLGVGPAAILGICAALLAGIAAVAALICARHPLRAARINAQGGRDIWARGLWANVVLGMALAQIDIVIGGLLLSPAQIGVYALLRRLANLAALPIAVTSWIGASAISTAHERADQPATQEAVRHFGRAGLWPAAALALGAMGALALAGQGAHWPLLALLLAGVLGQVVLAQAMTLASLTGQGRAAAASRALALLTYLGLALALLAPAGIWGNALAYVLASSLGNIALAVWLWRVLGIDCWPWQWRRAKGLAWQRG